MTPLDERKCQVLRAVVEDYVRSAEPVGSRTIAKKYGIGYSPATIRNDMADLKELGYLDQPHTSAGRVPSDKGYRFYVDRLMEPPSLSLEEAMRIRQLYTKGVRSVEWLIQQTVKLLSDATIYAAVAMGPEAGIQRLRSLKVLPMGTNEALMILITDQDVVHHRILEIPQSTSFEEVRATVALLEGRLRGIAVTELGNRALEDLFRTFASRRQILDQVVDLVMDSLVVAVDEEQVTVSGASKVMAQPEYHDIERLRGLLSFLERPQAVREVLLEHEGGMGIVIGGEHRVAGASDMSLVMAGLKRQGGVFIRFGVLGPKRMDYGRVVSLVEAVAGELDAVLG